MIIRSANIYTDQGIVDGYLIIEGKKIKAIENKDVSLTADLNVEELRILPGIIDTHNHGTMGYGLMGDTSDPKAVVKGYLKGLASQGVTACLPTAQLNYFEAIAELCDEETEGAKPLGIHSEGPYLNRVGEKGIDTGHPDILQEMLEEMVKKGKGKLKLVAIAPELPHAKEAIEYLTSEGIRCAFAHSDMNYAEAMEAFNWGITVSTHTANVMSGIHHRNMGGLGACLLHDNLLNEVICDGLHVSNEMLEIMFRSKKNAYNKMMMVSDNVPMAGAPVGRYELEGMFAVNIDDKGYCLSDTGRLCGSTLPVLKGIQNLAENMHIPLEDIVKMSSRNPAKAYGADEKGVLAVGKDADFIIIDKDYNVVRTYSEGRCVFDKDKDTHLFNESFLKKNILAAN